MVEIRTCIASSNLSSRKGLLLKGVSPIRFDFLSCLSFKIQILLHYANASFWWLVCAHVWTLFTQLNMDTKSVKSQWL